MYSFWLIIPVIIIVGILKFRKGKKKFDSNFYEGLTNTQLKNEATILLNKILNSFDEKSNFLYTEYKNLSHFKSEVQETLVKIKSNEIDELFPTTSIQTHNYLFFELAKKNDWSEKQIKLIKDLNLIIIEFSIRQGILPRNYHL
ncbi:hypothetical protein [Litoribaculum gwangyangense]